jgi:rhamnogalacturonan endolyase
VRKPSLRPSLLSHHLATACALVFALVVGCGSDETSPGTIEASNQGRDASVDDAAFTGSPVDGAAALDSGGTTDATPETTTYAPGDDAAVDAATEAAPEASASAPCTGPDVTVTQNGTTFVLDNGIVKATVHGTDATLPSLVYNGVETMQSGGAYSWGTNVYTAAAFTPGLSADPSKNGGDLAEVAMVSTFDGASGHVPLDLEVRYALPRCAHGIYEYVVLTHTSTQPAFTPGEMRINHYVRWDDVFDGYAVDDNRRGPYLSLADAASATTVAGAPPEVLKYSTGPFANRPGFQKYDSSLAWGDGNVYGWTSSKNNIGIWIVNPVAEYLPGGPRKTELTLHDNSVNGTIRRGALLNYWGGQHFYGAFEPVLSGQVLQKVVGPWLLYVNETSATGATGQAQLWADAQKQLATEKASWPYAWESDARYLPEAQRGSAHGQITLSDPTHPQASIAGGWVGLAGPPVGGVANFEREGWEYEYWVRADAQGRFTLSHVRPGKYTLQAFVAGVHGVYLGTTDGVVIRAGQQADLGTVSWVPDRLGSTLWELGTPDRSPAEFLHGDEPWHWGLELLYPSDFPHGVSFTIGTSDPHKDWNYFQPQGTWNVQFQLASAPGAASLLLDAAGSDEVTIGVLVNGKQVATVDFTPHDSSIDRDQPYGAWRTARVAIPAGSLRAGANTIALSASAKVMWDYLRLEKSGP